MKSLLNNVNELDYLIRQLQKLASRIRSGEIIDAWRELNGLIGYVNKAKQDLIKEVENKYSEPNKQADNTIDFLIINSNDFILYYFVLFL